MITGMDRLVAALDGKPSDRIPVFCNLIDQGASELGISIEEYFSNGEYVAEAQLSMREKYGHDNLWALFYVGKEAELLGCQKMCFSKEGSPNVEDFVIKEPGDVNALVIPDDLTAHPAFQESLKCLNRLRREAGGKYPICAYLSSSMTLPALLMGMDRWFELLFMGPANLRDELLEKCHAFFVKEARTYRNLGADVLVYSNPFGSLETVPKKFFQEYALPWIERDIQAVGASGIVYYCGTSSLKGVIEPVLERTGIGVYYLSPLDDIGACKRAIAGRGLTCGIINDICLIDWPTEKIRSEVKRIIEAGLPGGRFLFGTGVMPFEIPEASIHTMLQAAFEYGALPQGGAS